MPDEARKLAASGISELLHIQPLIHPISKETLRPTQEAIDRVAHILQTFHSRMQRYVSEAGVLALGSFIEACPLQRFAISHNSR